MTQSIDGDRDRLPPPPRQLPVGSTDALDSLPEPVAPDGSAPVAETDPLATMQRAFEEQLTGQVYEKLRGTGGVISGQLKARGILDASGEDLINDALRRTYAGTVTWHHEREKVPLVRHIRYVAWSDFRALVRKRAGEVWVRTRPESCPATEAPDEHHQDAHAERASLDALPGGSEVDGAHAEPGDPSSERSIDTAEKPPRGASMSDALDVPEDLSPGEARHARAPATHVDVEQQAGDDDPVRRMEQRSLLREVGDVLWRIAAMSADQDLRYALIALFHGARGEQDLMAMMEMDHPRARRAWRMVRRLICEIPDDLRAEARELM
ncbi:MAG: hypothetical protein HS111_06900 [Kofleriaceae bacterium]|nr:hypothetical protein [Kofleriaceae bacterium]MCL4225591.1 hypothetical protein [Myxococcales bacterium]